VFPSLSPPAALAALDAAATDYVVLFRHGTLEVGVYRPVKVDDQKPHTRDELYVVISGSGTFVAGDERRSFVPNDVLFAAAGLAHRFENFTDDFTTWVFFYGPPGGEVPA
jgi:mannose-6-phosphate isomerase-like protein (cupin superfamily)